jgi:hypothetical protein
MPTSRVAKTVAYDPSAGPVTLRITSGYATMGGYRCSIEKKRTWTEFGAGDLSDDVPDEFVVPLEGSALDGRSVLILGNYRAALSAGSKLVKVTYEFLQQQAAIDRTDIEAETEDVVHDSSMFTFEEGS